MYTDIVKALGGRRIFGSGSRHINLIDEVERGLPTRSYSVIAEALDLTPDEEDRLLQVSLRTRARWKQRKRLDPAVSDRLQSLLDVGLGYLELGQSATTLSGGEAQRVKIETDRHTRSASPSTGRHL